MFAVQAEKNLAWEAAQQQSATLAQMNALAAGGAGAGPCKLFVGNLHSNIAVRCCAAVTAMQDLMLGAYTSSDKHEL